MATPVYEWNPFQERVSNRVSNEIIKPATENGRFEFIPRCAPFFSRNFELRVRSNPTPLKLGVDYVFGHTFDNFINKYSRNCFGSVILLKEFNALQLTASYDNIGGPFILDEIAYAELVANIVNLPRTADWGDIVDIPEAFPADPHEHPALQTYDYLEMTTLLRSLILAITTVQQEDGVKELLEAHLSKPLFQAHAGDKGDFGLDDVVNNSNATVEDLAGNSSSKNINVNVLKAAFRLFQEGKLEL